MGGDNRQLNHAASFALFFRRLRSPCIMHPPIYNFPTMYEGLIRIT
jgi:hypothetical protein